MCKYKNMDEGKSEVSRLRAQLDAECEAANRAMYGFAEVAKHAFITARMERVGEIHDQLQGLVGEQEAVEMLTVAMERKAGHDPSL
jgi:hypothetical protein